MLTWPSAPGRAKSLALEHIKRLGAYADRIVEQKRHEPADDILSVIVHAQLEDGSPQLDNRELRAFFALLFPAGAETTRSFHCRRPGGAD